MCKNVPKRLSIEQIVNILWTILYLKWEYLKQFYSNLKTHVYFYGDMFSLGINA